MQQVCKRGPGHDHLCGDFQHYNLQRRVRDGRADADSHGWELGYAYHRILDFQFFVICIFEVY